VRVLVACEYSGTVRRAFHEIGIKAYSCDLLPIVNFPGYAVSNDGRVFGCRTNMGFGKWKQLTPSPDAKGYLGLTLTNGPKVRRKARVHRLVAEAFLPNPKCLPCVRHLDGNPENNKVGNLSWGTYRSNERDKIRHGTWDTRFNGKLSKDDRQMIRQLSREGWSQKSLAELFDVSRPTITRLLNQTTWVER